MKKYKKLLIILVIVITSPIWLILMFILFINTYDNVRLQIYADSFFNYTLPPQTKIVSKKAEWNYNVEGSADCVSDIEMKVSTYLSRDEIQNYYDLITQNSKKWVVWTTVDDNRTPSTMTLEADGIDCSTSF